MLAVDTQSFFTAPQETASIGDKAAGKSEVLLTSDKAVATFIGVRWDGDKVRGIRMELSDGSFKQAGGYDDAKYTLTTYNFAAGETPRSSWTLGTAMGACARLSSRHR
jgi:hypothetical protein